MKQEHTHCLICNSAKLIPLKNYNATSLLKCRHCGFVFSARIPSNDELVRIYNAYGRDDYLSPVTVKRYHEILDLLEKYRKTNCLLDIGCGIGYFLEEAIKRGWKTHGTEFTERATEICTSKGIQMNQGVLDPKNYHGISFDVITSFEVIEHINNPLGEINNIKQILRVGGLIFITTPNFNSFLRLFLRDRWNVISYPEHLSYYTPKTLKYLFVSNGFRKVSLQTTGFSITRFRNSLKKDVQNNISDISCDEKLRSEFEKNKLLGVFKNFLNGLLRFLGKGDTIKGLFIKINS